MKRHQFFAAGMVAMLTIVVATTGFAAPRGTTFTPVGLFPLCDDVPEGEFCENFPLTTAVDISPDGKSVVGMHAFFSGNYIWTAETGVQTIGPVAGAPWFYNNGAGIASTPLLPPDFEFSQSGVWTGGFYPDQTWDLIPTPEGFSRCDFSGQSVHGAGNGNYITGLTWIDRDGNGNGCDGASGFLWDGTDITVLDNSVNNDSTRGNAVNADGSVVVGWMQTTSREASKWVNGVQDFICPDPTGLGGNMFCSEGWDVTPDGSSMLTSGVDITVGFTTRAQVVDQDGNMTELPFPEGVITSPDDTFAPFAISDDGNTVVGQYGGSGFFGSPPYPVFWNRQLGQTIDLQVFLLAQGLDDLAFWFLQTATAVSADGTTIAGHGTNPEGWLEAYVVNLGKVKVCHKPDGNGNGANRTLNVAWDSVAGHLGHGDDLSTCEFAGPGGGARTVKALWERRQQAQSPADDNLANPGMLNHQRTGGNSYEGAAADWSLGEPAAIELRERKTRQLADRIRKANR